MSAHYSNTMVGVFFALLSTFATGFMDLGTHMTLGPFLIEFRLGEFTCVLKFSQMIVQL